MRVLPRSEGRLLRRIGPSFCRLPLVHLPPDVSHRLLVAREVSLRWKHIQDWRAGPPQTAADEPFRAAPLLAHDVSYVEASVRISSLRAMSITRAACLHFEPPTAACGSVDT